MDSKILTLAKLESKRKKLFFLIVPIFLLLSLLNVYTTELFSIQAKWMEKFGEHRSSGEVLSQIISQFSVSEILKSADFPIGLFLLLCGVFVAAPLYLLLWLVLPSYLKETHKGWKRIYVVASIFSVFLSLFYLRDMTHNLIIQFIVKLFFLIVMILVLVIGVRWVFSGFEKEKNL